MPTSLRGPLRADPCDCRLPARSLAPTACQAPRVRLRQQWPASAKADIIAFATSLSVESGADYAVAGDFKFDTFAHCTRKECYWSGNDASMGPDLQRDNTDSDESTAQAQKCRADLGLPPING